MFFRHHNPSHFHAEYQGEEALFDIQTLEILGGSLPKHARLLATEWALEHRAELLTNWEKAARPEPLLKIEPLS
ncbi:DUF4160 domain-containing protein [uncultured Hymenobacter sp.]|uniref:DUF4160 domain-containing protein n=1 Tax=uncultured Hymenobacter sp. TaxID=170016 RepID=UPI0035CC4EB1